MGVRLAKKGVKGPVLGGAALAVAALVVLGLDCTGAFSFLGRGLV
jgi:hypothetical protein